MHNSGTEDSRTLQVLQNHLFVGQTEPAYDISPIKTLKIFTINNCSGTTASITFLQL